MKHKKNKKITDFEPRVVDLVRDGDNRLALYAKRLRLPKHQSKSNLAKFKQVIRDVWEKIMEFSTPGVPVSTRAIRSALNMREEYFDSALSALERAGKLKHDAEKRIVTVIYK